MSCIVVGCKSHSSRKENDAKIISFHRFPSDVDMRQKWINAIARNNWEWKKQHRICSKHFSDDCFINIGHKWRSIYVTMSNQASPTDSNRPSKIIRFDKNYVHSIPGILKLVQIACNIVGFICIKISWSWVSAIFYNILYWFATIVSSLLLLAYTLHFVEKFDRWPWHRLEFFYCAIVALTYLGCSIFATTIGESVGYAVGFFGLCAIIAYSFDGYLKYKSMTKGLPPQ